MTKAWLGVTGVCLVAAFSGCGGKDTLDIEAEIDARVSARTESFARVTETLNKRLSKLEEENAGIHAQFEELKTLHQKKIADEAETAVDQKVKGLVTKWLDEQGSGEQAVNQVVAATFDGNFTENMKAYEERKEAEAEAKREVERQDREKRRREAQESRVARVAEELGLNDVQAAQLLESELALQTGVRLAFETMREQGNFDREAMHTTMTTMRDTHLKAVGEFMNEEQVAAYKEKQDRMFPFGGSHGGDHGGRGGPGGSPGGGR